MKIGRRKLLVLCSSLFLSGTTLGCSVNNANNAGNKIISNAREIESDLTFFTKKFIVSCESLEI